MGELSEGEAAGAHQQESDGVGCVSASRGEGQEQIQGGTPLEGARESCEASRRTAKDS